MAPSRTIRTVFVAMVWPGFQATCCLLAKRTSLTSDVSQSRKKLFSLAGTIFRKSCSIFLKIIYSYSPKLKEKS